LDGLLFRFHPDPKLLVFRLPYRWTASSEALAWLAEDYVRQLVHHLSSRPAEGLHLLLQIASRLRFACDTTAKSATAQTKADPLLSKEATMTVIQGVLDKAGKILSADGGFTAGRSSPTQYTIDVTGQDVSGAFILATTTHDDGGVPPQPVTIYRPRRRSSKFILLVDTRYGVSFRVEIPNSPNSGLRRTAKAKQMS
jgi:hypothetical protein